MTTKLYMQTFGVSMILFLKDINTFIQQGQSDSKDY